MPYALQIPQTGSPEVLTKVETDLPQLAADEVLIRNQATAVNFIDTIIRRGEMPEGMMPALPHVPGVEGTGIVQAVGADVTGLTIGQRVAWMGELGAGGYGTHAVVKQSYVLPVSEDLAPKVAAALPVNGMTAWHMLVNLGRAQAGQTVLIHAAAGGVGTVVIQIAKSLGLTVIGSVSTDKVQYTLDQGADYAVDYQKESLVQRVAEITGGKGVDLTLNPVSGPSVKADLEMLAPLGTAVLFGFLAGMPEGTFADDLAKHFGKSIAVRVSDIYTYYVTQPDRFKADFEQLLNKAAAGEIKPVIYKTLPLEQAAKAHELLESGQVQGKLVLTIDA